MLFRKTAPEIISTKEQWINSEPLTLEKLRGKIALLDFWTYSCINCLRTLPALKAMWEKYKGKNVVIIGIHTPEFEFEKDIENVKAAVKRHGIKYPVLNDPKRTNWDRYGNTYWPRAAMINAKGEIIFEHVGESGYGEIDKKIIEELKTGEPSVKEEKRTYSPKISPETYAGSTRNQGIGSSEVCTKEGCNEYFDPGEHRENVIYLSGQWKQEPEYLEFEGKEGYISFRYYAREVNVVMDGKGNAEVLLDGKPLEKKDTGTHAVLSDKKSYVKIGGADMYNVVKSDGFKSGELKIVAFKGMRVYAYTFG